MLEKNETNTVELSSAPAFDVTVKSTTGWQATGINLDVGDILNISWLSGQWVGRKGDPYHGPEGPTYDAYPGGPNYPLPGVVEDSMVGKIGSAVFSVGRQLRFKVREAGSLALTINDIGYHDNDGEITMRIMITE
jgi:hypothetical protein